MNLKRFYYTYSHDEPKIYYISILSVVFKDSILAIQDIFFEGVDIKRLKMTLAPCGAYMLHATIDAIHLTLQYFFKNYLLSNDNSKFS